MPENCLSLPNPAAAAHPSSHPLALLPLELDDVAPDQGLLGTSPHAASSSGRCAGGGGGSNASVITGSDDLACSGGGDGGGDVGGDGLAGGGCGGLVDGGGGLGDGGGGCGGPHRSGLLVLEHLVAAAPVPASGDSN
jgi:hypothetical protein